LATVPAGSGVIALCCSPPGAHAAACVEWRDKLQQRRLKMADPMTPVILLLLVLVLLATYLGSGTDTTR
jgi:hypothetical protein